MKCEYQNKRNFIVIRYIVKEVESSTIRHSRNVSSITDHHLYFFLFTTADLSIGFF